MSSTEILKLRKCRKGNDWFDIFLFKSSEKILKRLVFPYYRLEVLLNCIIDIKENKQYYPTAKPNEIKKIDIIFDKLQKFVCT